MVLCLLGACAPEPYCQRSLVIAEDYTITCGDDVIACVCDGIEQPPLPAYWPVCSGAGFEAQCPAAAMGEPRCVEPVSGAYNTNDRPTCRATCSESGCHEL